MRRAALIGVWASASLAVTVVDAPVLGPPTTSVTITGTAFAASEAVDVYLDTTDTLLTAPSMPCAPAPEH